MADRDGPLYIGFRALDVDSKRRLDHAGDTMGLSSREQLMRMIVSMFLEDFAANEDKTTTRGYRHLRKINAQMKSERSEGFPPAGPRRGRRR